jgi:hypothetical protein
MGGLGVGFAEIARKRRPSPPGEFVRRALRSPANTGRATPSIFARSRAADFQQVRHSAQVTADGPGLDPTTALKFLVRPRGLVAAPRRSRPQNCRAAQTDPEKLARAGQASRGRRFGCLARRNGQGFPHCRTTKALLGLRRVSQRVSDVRTGVLHDRSDSLRVVCSIVVVAEPNKPAIQDNRGGVAEIRRAVVHG